MTNVVYEITKRCKEILGICNFNKTKLIFLITVLCISTIGECSKIYNSSLDKSLINQKLKSTKTRNFKDELIPNIEEKTNNIPIKDVILEKRINLNQIPEVENSDITLIKHINDFNTNFKSSNKINDHGLFLNVDNNIKSSINQSTSINNIKVDINNKNKENKETKVIKDDSTKHSDIKKLSFLEGVLKSFSLNYFAELGDKSFILIITLFNTYDSAAGLLVACLLGQLTMTSISCILGNSFQAYLTVKITKIFYLIGFVMFTIYGISFLFDYIQSILPVKHQNYSKNRDHDNEEDCYIQDSEDSEIKDDVCCLSCQENKNKDKAAKEKYNYNKMCMCKHDNENVNNISTISLKIVQSLNINQKEESCFSQYLKVYGFIFIAELGDRSSIATIILSAKYNAFSIFVGNIFAHFFGIVTAMIVGYLLKTNINLNLLKLLSSLVFFAFALEMGYNYFTTSNSNTSLIA